MEWKDLPRPSNVGNEFTFHKWTVVGKFRISTYKVDEYLPSASCETAFINQEDMDNQKNEMTKFWNINISDEELLEAHWEMCLLAEEFQED